MTLPYFMKAPHLLFLTDQHFLVARLGAYNMLHNLHDQRCTLERAAREIMRTAVDNASA
jgi:hypothetical protein